MVAEFLKYKMNTFVCTFNKKNQPFTTNFKKGYLLLLGISHSNLHCIKKVLSKILPSSNFNTTLKISLIWLQFNTLAHFLKVHGLIKK